MIVEGTSASDSFTTAISSVQVSALKCCIPVTNGNGGFQIKLSTADDSPSATVNIVDRMVITSGVTVQFPGFGGFTATFENNGPVPVNTDITDAVIILYCTVLISGDGGTSTITVPFT